MITWMDRLKYYDYDMMDGWDVIPHQALVHFALYCNTRTEMLDSKMGQ